MHAFCLHAASGREWLAEAQQGQTAARCVRATTGVKRLYLSNENASVRQGRDRRSSGISQSHSYPSTARRRRRPEIILAKRTGEARVVLGVGRRSDENAEQLSCRRPSIGLRADYGESGGV